MNKRINYKEVVLKTLLATSLLAVALVAPNAIKVLGPIVSKKKRENFNYATNKKIFVLAKEGFVKFISKNGQKFITLTKKGETELEKYILGDLVIKKPKRWDGKWRIVSYDVKNYRTRNRNALRGHLQRLGFIQYQKSLWVHPYDCEEIIVLLKSHLKFGREVMYIVADHLENDRELRLSFDLM